MSFRDELPVDGQDPRTPGAAGRIDLDLVARLPSKQRAPERRIRRNAANTRDLDLQALAPVILELYPGGDSDRVPCRVALVHHQRPAEAVAQQRDASLEQALFVLRR